MSAETIQVMARQSAQLRDDVNRAPVFLPGPKPVAGGSGGEPPKREKTMADNRPMVKLREKLLGLGGRKVTLELGGDKYLLVAPNERTAAAIQNAALKYSLKKGPDGQPARDPQTGKPTGEMDFSMDQLELKVRALIECARDAETGKPLFAQNDPTEIEAICNAPVSATRRELMEACVGMIRPDTDEVEKNSSATPGVSSSSASP